MVYYRPITLDDYEGVRALLLLCGLDPRLAEESRLRRMIDNADRTVGAFEGERLVGYASALCDEAFYGCVGPVCVHPNHRSKGIGAELVAQLIEDSPEVTWLVRSGGEGEAFWQKAGFSASAAAMEKLRQR